ncbi:MAG: recombinase family protein [Thermodesulfobacteriota bacterium]
MKKQIGIIYTRVSTDRQAQEGISLDAQLTRCLEYAESKGIEVLETITDAGLSAATIEKRPGLVRALGLIGKGKAAHLITYRLDRLTRNTADFLGLAAQLEKKKAQLHLVGEDGALRTDSADSEFLATLRASLAARERKLVSERTKVALARKRERCEYCGGQVPYGYSVQNGKLIPNTEEQQVIRKVRNLRRKGFSIRRIVEHLTEHGILNRKGKAFGKTSVERILKKEAA